jgi:hypothetical protein
MKAYLRHSVFYPMSQVCETAAMLSTMATSTRPHLATRKTAHDMSAEHLCLPLLVHMNLNCVLFPTHTAVYLLTKLLLKKHTSEYEGMITTRASNYLGHCRDYFAVSGK